MPLDPEDRKRLALELLDSIATGDADQVLARMSNEPSWGFFAQRFPGVEGVSAIVKASSELYEAGSQTREILAIYCDGPTVIIKTSMRARTFKGEDYENLYVMFVHFDGEESDEVHLVEEFMDTAYGDAKFSGWEMSD